MNNPMSNPIGIADAFCKKYADAMAKIESVRLMKGKELPDWPYWCFLPLPCWVALFMGKQHQSLTQVTRSQELWQETEKLSVLGTWRYSKGIYTLPPSLLNALTETSLSDSLPADVLLRLPEWCIYVRTPDLFIEGERLYGFWAMTNSDDFTENKSLFLLLNRQSGIRTELLPLKDSSVSAIIETAFHQKLDVSGAEAELKESIKQSEVVSDYLKRKSETFCRLLSILLYICSDEPEIDSERQPGTYPVRPAPVKTKKGYRLFPASGPRYWTVGEKTGRLLDEAALYDDAETTSSTGRHMRTHLRRGHWHGFWSGKMDGSEARKFSYRWLPPQVIGGHRKP
ncbi:TPA: hypothetical protein H2W71_004133 [Salmonella enterica]|nr:hypothetical protein [Salmonella enterica]HAK8462335.1 hypothetical protein [Salmonella enterica]